MTSLSLLIRCARYGSLFGRRRTTLLALLVMKELMAWAWAVLLREVSELEGPFLLLVSPLHLGIAGQWEFVASSSSSSGTTAAVFCFEGFLTVLASVSLMLCFGGVGVVSRTL